MPPHAIVKWALPAKLAKPFVLNQTAIDEESLQIPLGASFLVGILWFFFDWRVRKHASKTFGSVLDEDGMPRWRCASGVATQLLVLPALFGLSLASSGYSLSAWSETAGSAYFTEDGLRFYDWAFCYVFAAYMLSDVVLLKSTLSFLLKLHHVGCLIGTAFAFACCPSGFPFFACGVIALEVGSACMNVWCLFPHRTDTFWAYIIVMSGSNAIATLCAVAWLRQAFPFAAKLVGAGMSATFILLRQQAVSTVLATRRRERRGKRESAQGGKRVEELAGKRELSVSTGGAESVDEGGVDRSFSPNSIVPETRAASARRRSMSKQAS